MSDGQKAVRALLARPVAFHPALARLCGSVTAGLFLSQALYWTRVAEKTREGGWFYKTRTQWAEELCLSRDEQETARAKLKALGLLEERYASMPKQLYYRVCEERLIEALGEMEDNPPASRRESRPAEGGNAANSESARADGGNPANKTAGKPPSRRRESRQQDGGKAANKTAGKPPTCGRESRRQLLIGRDYTETTAETTTTAGDAAVVAAALGAWAATDAAAGRQLLRACRRVRPDVSGAEIAALVDEKGPGAASPRVENPVGLLLTVVPQCCEGEWFERWRAGRAASAREGEERARREREERERVAREVVEDPTAPQWLRANAERALSEAR